MKNEMITSAIPSEATGLLKSYIGKKIVRLIRYSWWPDQEAAEQCAISDEQVFSLTAGPFAIQFDDGSILGVASDPGLNSVIVWNEAFRRREDASSSLELDQELFAISASGRFAATFWKQLIGRRLTGIRILRRADNAPKESIRPSEVGLRFEVGDETSFVASHGLHDNSDDFSVLDPSVISGLALIEEELP